MSFTYSEREMDKIRIIQKLCDKTINIKQAKEGLKVSERTIYRYKATLNFEGPPGFIHGLQGRPSNNGGIGKLEKYKKYAIKKKYNGFGPTLLAESLEEELGWGKVNPESLRLKMVKWGLWLIKKKTEKVHRQERERRPKVGMMIQFDGSYHDWLENGEKSCLLLAVDDATSELKRGTFTQGETLLDISKFWFEYFEKFGKPGSIYVDCHATYKVNHEQDMFDEEMKTRFQRAMGKLGVEVIYSKCPQGKGRVERAFGTLQDRLVKKMRLYGCKNTEEANLYIENVYIPAHNKKFAKGAKEPGNGHQIFSEEEKLKYNWFFAKETIRIIKKDGTAQYMGKKYQIEKNQRLYNGKKLVVHETLYGEIKIYSGIYELNYHILNRKT